MKQYPLILIPDAIKQVKPQIPPVLSLVKPQPPIKPLRPQPLPPEPQPVNPMGLVVRSTIGLGVSAGFGYLFASILGNPNWGLIVGGLLGIISLLIIILWTMSERRDFGKRKQRHEQLQRTHLLEMAQYQQQMKVFEQQQQQYSSELSVYNQASQPVQQGRTPLLQVLAGTKTFQGKNDNPPRGESEERFESYLKSYFPGKIHIGLTLRHPRYSKGYHYTADFAYIDRETNLHINIEIDEPYKKGKTKEPIHYIGLKNEVVRNEFFLDYLWIVIRFSEEQVIGSPKNCCRTSASVSQCGIATFPQN